MKKEKKEKTTGGASVVIDGKETAMKAFVSSTDGTQQLAMIRNQDGEIAPAWIRIRDDRVDEIQVNGVFRKVKGIELDTRHAKAGVIWKFKEPVRLSNVTATRFRVVDVGHNMFEALDCMANVPGKGEKGNKSYRPPVSYEADIPCFIHDWGTRQFTVCPPVKKKVIRRQKESRENVFEI